MVYVPVCEIINKNNMYYDKTRLASIIHSVLLSAMKRPLAAKTYAEKYNVEPILHSPSVQATEVIHPPHVDPDKELAEAYIKLTEWLADKKFYIVESLTQPNTPVCVKFSALINPRKIYVGQGYIIALNGPELGSVPVKFFYTDKIPRNTGEYYEDDIEKVVTKEDKTDKFMTLIITKTRKSFYGHRMYNIPYKNITHLEKILSRIEYGPVAVTLYDGKHTTKDALKAVIATHVLTFNNQVPILFINDYEARTIDIDEILKKYPNTIMRVNGEVTTPLDVPHAGRGIPYEKLYKEFTTHNR